MQVAVDGFRQELLGSLPEAESETREAASLACDVIIMF